MNEYMGYQIDTDIWELSERDFDTIKWAVDFIDNNWSLRELSRNICVPFSTIQKRFNNELSYLSYELYCLVQRRYKEHNNHTRG